ncbi:DNA-methyltransferase [Granulicatella adiacens]|uniref:DNA-methyltransferase n=1 Tax=Granulicatella adiacens TaxID=46124 RepID=UPI0021A487F3|nr:site-specific DNA-methyltransferase [Granulicatella adiacens]MCT2160031.1 site-specific DNA-methyltransferase [Granulicatella adiacens]
MELNKIHNEDCLVGMNKIPDKSIDMILCDLPYGTTKNEWDVMLPLDELWKQYERIIKDNGAIVLTAQTPFDKILGASNTKLLRYEWIWEKSLGTGHLNANKMPLKSHENILVFYKELPIYNPQFTYGKPYKQLNGKISSPNYGKQIRIETNNEGYRYPKSVLFFESEKNNFHPTQKPVSLCEYFIKTYTNEGDVVLDNCIGSGTTAIACLNTKRNFIGFEKNTEYFKKATDRINKHTIQTYLF